MPTDSSGSLRGSCFKAKKRLILFKTWSKGRKRWCSYTYNNKDASFLFKERFSKRLLNDEFQNFGKEKTKIPLSAIWLVQRDFSFHYSSLLYQSEILFVLHCLMIISPRITTLQDDILQEVWNLRCLFRFFTHLLVILYEYQHPYARMCSTHQANNH